MGQIAIRIALWAGLSERDTRELVEYGYDGLARIRSHWLNLTACSQNCRIRGAKEGLILDSFLSPSKE